MRPFLRWLVVLAVVGPAWATVTIDLYCNGGKANCSLQSYDDEDVFTSRYANIPGSKISGRIMEPSPNNACLYITPLPDSLKANDSKWFALVDDYPDCPEQMIDNVRNAGFDLIIAYRSNSSIRGLSTSVENTGFPIVVIDDDYAHYLLDNALSRSPTDPITARIEVDDYDFVIVIFAFLAASACLSFPCILLVACCVKKCRQRRGLYTVNTPRHNIPIRDHHAQARLARQELIESILRQLQELQGEARQHIPLGEEDTKALPLRPFIEMKRESRGKETCAICVDEFQEGDMTRVLPCNHYFHPHCIDPWLTSHSSLCPLCKQSVPRRNEQPAGGGARPRMGVMPIPVLLETSSEEESSVSSEEFGSAQSVQLNGVVDVSPPVEHQPADRNRDSVSVSSASPLLHTPENA